MTKSEAEIARLRGLDIIEPVDGPTTWLKPILPVPKSDGSICLCIDMQRANEAIEIVLTGNQGAKNISNDVLIWGATIDELKTELLNFRTTV